MEMVKIFLPSKSRQYFDFRFMVFLLVWNSSKFKSTGTRFWFSWRHMSVIIDYLHRNVNWNKDTHTRESVVAIFWCSMLCIFIMIFHFWWQTYCYQQSIA